MTSLCWQPILTNCPRLVNRWNTATACRTHKEKAKMINKHLPKPLSLSLSQVIKDLKGSDYSWSYQTPPSSPSSSGSRKSSMCRYSHTHTHTCTQTWPQPCVINSLSIRKRSLLCFTVAVSLSVCKSVNHYCLSSHLQSMEYPHKWTTAFRWRTFLQKYGFFL